jgi:hypothetical protein
VAKTGDTTGEGTLYDPDDNELATVAYRIDLPHAGGRAGQWSGELFFPDETMMVDPGLYVLATEDGTRSDVEVLPPIGGGDPRQRRFIGVGSFGDRIV